MAVVCSRDEGYVLDHQKAIDLSCSCGGMGFRDVFFEICTPFMKDLQAGKVAAWMEGQEPDDKPKKRRKADGNKNKAEDWISLLGHNNTEKQQVDCCDMEKATHLLVQEGRTKGSFLACLSPEDVRANNRRARESVNAFYRDFPARMFQATLADSNPGLEAVLVQVEGNAYVVPPKTRYYCDDISNLDKLKGEKFDCIVMDPPWWNKYIRRRKAKQMEAGYQMLYDDDLLSMPIEELMADGALIVVWCTNSPSHLNAVQETLFPRWKVTYVSKWYWVKVTKTGIPVCPFQTNSGKQPYEQILFGRYTPNSKTAAVSPEDGKLIVSIPSSIHSHKPPLNDVLRGYLKESPKCLELFARSLIPGWTSWGNEVLKLQHLSLYQQYNPSSE